jgi:CBS domain containing-hemolysin-like protein
VLTPITWIIEKGTSHFTRDRKKIVSEEELKILSEIGRIEGSIERDEEELIRRAFTLNDMVARDIMTPWNVVDTLQGSKTVGEVASDITHKPYSRYPVMGASPDVVGSVQTKDLLIALWRDGENELVSHFMQAPLFVKDTKRVDDLLALFLAGKRHLAVVQTGPATFVGVVTLEDVIEQLVGEIVDESDEVVDLRTLSSERAV